MNTPFKLVNYLRQGETLNYDYQINLPVPLADWDVFDYWERERTVSMEMKLKPEDVLFDIGAEHGWLSVVYASMCKVFLIEPTKEFWPNIFRTWIANRSEDPIGCFNGLIGAASDENISYSAGWPPIVYGEMIDKNKYEYLDAHTEGIQTISIDDLVKLSGIIPTALTIDIEGAELLALKGGYNTIKNNDLKIWVSIHADLMGKYNTTEEQLYRFMSVLGYKGTHLATDHEAHWYFHR